MRLGNVRRANAGVTLKGKSAVVVGGTSGIGMGIALRLAQAGVATTIVGRNEGRAKEILAQMDAASADASVKHSFLKCDSFLINNIYAATKEYSSSHDKLDFLVLTQGMGSIQGRTETKEGIDEKLALHYYGRMAFTLALLPLLRKAGNSHVLSVLSPGIHPPYAQYQQDPELKTNYSVTNAANAGCFYNDIAVDALSREEGNGSIAFSHMAPGFVATNWGTEMPWYIRGVVRAAQVFGKSPQDCAEFAFAAMVKEAPGMHLYDEYGEPTPQRTSLHDAARDFVWAHTRSLLERVAPSSL